MYVILLFQNCIKITVTFETILALLLNIFPMFAISASKSGYIAETQIAENTS